MLCDICVHSLQGEFDLIDMLEVTIRRLPFVGGQRLASQPLPPADAREIAMRTWRDQMRVKDRLDQVLQADSLPYELRPPGDLASQR
jgi:hypothetical protein